MQNHRNRKLNRLKEYDYSLSGWYFITICTKDRECLFGEIIEGKMRLSEIGKATQKCWQEISIHFPDVKLGEFIIMPNHIHGIIVIENNNVGNKNFCSLQSQQSWQTKWARSLSSIVRGFKIGVTKCRQQPIWQKSYYDHIIRNENSLIKIREYIINNPLKWENDRNNSENLWM